MKAKLLLEGKEFDIEIQDPEMIEMLTKQSQAHKTGYEKVKEGDCYYVDDSIEGVEVIIEECDTTDRKLYDVANYYTDMTLAEDNARADMLMRRLRRFAAEENKRCADWDSDSYKRVIYYNHNSKNLSYYSFTTTHTFGAIAFDSDEGVKKAMEIYRDELIWYFTEYKSSL